MNIQYIFRIASLNTKNTGFFRIYLESDLIMCFQIFQKRVNYTRLPVYQQKHQKYRRQTLTRSPFVDPKHKKLSISLEIFSPSTILLAFFSLSLKSLSIYPPKMLSGLFKNPYFCLICVYLLTFTTSFGNRNIDESLKVSPLFVLIDDKNCSSELQSYTQVTDSSSSSYSSSRAILFDILLNSFVIISDHLRRYCSISGLESFSIGRRLVLFCKQLLISPLSLSSLPLRSNARCSYSVVGGVLVRFLRMRLIISRLAVQNILLSFMRVRMLVDSSSGTLSDSISNLIYYSRKLLVETGNIEFKRVPGCQRWLQLMLEDQQFQFTIGRFCAMLYNLSKPELPPTEDLAISSLLQIGQKELQYVDNWQDKTKLMQPKMHRKYSLHHKPPIAKQKSPVKPSQKPTRDELTPRLQYNPQIYRENDEIDIDAALKRDNCSSSRNDMSQSQRESEGEFWCSKVNWTSNDFKKEHRSQPKMSKKFSYGYQANGRSTWRGNSRYQLQQKIQHQEYKTNLIYSILSGQADLMRLKHLHQETDKIFTNNRSCQNSPRENSIKKQSFNKNELKQKEDNGYKINKILQKSMRQTLKKISARNLLNGIVNSNSPFNKQSQLQRGSFVRQMLLNMQSSKEKGSLKQQKHEIYQTRLQKPQERYSQVMQNLIQPFYPNEQQKKKIKNILNLNLQAEKVYKNKSTNRWAGRKPIPALKVQ